MGLIIKMIFKIIFMSQILKHGSRRRNDVIDVIRAAFGPAAGHTTLNKMRNVQFYWRVTLAVSLLR